LHNNGFQRNTRQRQVILEELHGVKDHPTAAILYDRVRKRLPRISLGTVYRNLELLARSGEIHKLELAGSETRFDADIDQHYHVRCLSCGCIGDVHEIAGDLLGDRYRELSGYLVQGHRLEFQGLCPDCRHDRQE